MRIQARLRLLQVVRACAVGMQISGNHLKSTINDDAPGDLRMDGFMATLVFGWHPLIEGSRRLKSE